MSGSAFLTFPRVGNLAGKDDAEIVPIDAVAYYGHLGPKEGAFQAKELVPAFHVRKSLGVAGVDQVLDTGAILGATVLVV